MALVPAELGGRIRLQHAPGAFLFFSTAPDFGDGSLNGRTPEMSPNEGLFHGPRRVKHAAAHVVFRFRRFNDPDRFARVAVVERGRDLLGKATASVRRRAKTAQPGADTRRTFVLRSRRRRARAAGRRERDGAGQAANQATKGGIRHKRSIDQRCGRYRVPPRCHAPEGQDKAAARR